MQKSNTTLPKMVSTIATATFTAIPIDTDVAIPVRQHMDKNKKRTRRRRQGHNSLQVLFLAFLLLLACVTTAKKDPDLYEILGVKKTATTKEIKKAYRKKALDTHPDKRKDIPAEQAAEEFHKVVHAFEILSDESSRKTYDRTGRAQPNEGGRGGNQQQQQWGGGFQFHFRQGGGSYRSRQWRLKDQFKVQEAMSRVMHIVSLTQLETVMLDDNDVLERNLLMVFVTPQGVEENVDDEICFPYPFAAMSEQGAFILVFLVELWKCFVFNFFLTLTLTLLFITNTSTLTPHFFTQAFGGKINCKPSRFATINKMRLPNSLAFLMAMN